jgi:hypothetical protein
LPGFFTNVIKSLSFFDKYLHLSDAFLYIRQPYPKTQTTP